ncbi:MAG: hypothetical protein IPH10_14560 [bacterium]|nr:hypothetical protein [bacterium]
MPGLQAILIRVGFAVLFLSASFVSHLIAAPLTVNAPSNTYFIANEGQWEGDFQFKCEVGSAVYYVTPKGLTVDFREFKRYPMPRDPGNPLDMMDRHEDRDSVTVRGHVVQIQYSGANRSLTSMGEGKLAHYSNYFFGRDSTQWRSRVGHYQNIIVPEVWPGIDVEYRADQLGVEAVYHVKPGADPAQIQMEYLGLDAPLRIDAQGNLVLTTSLGEMKEQAPFAFQPVSRMQQRVESRYRIDGESRVEFELGAYDAKKTLVVDPLVYSSYFAGGGFEDLWDFAVDYDENKILCGWTASQSIDFPITPGAYGSDIFLPNGGFVSKLSPDGTELIFSTMLPGEAWRVCTGLDGSIYVFSFTTGDWPLTSEPFDSVYQGGPHDFAFARLSPDGTELVYGSYLAGDGWDEVDDCEVMSDGRIVIVGQSGSTDFPLTPDAFFDYTGGRPYISVFDPAINQVSYSTAFGQDPAHPSNTGIHAVSISDEDDIWVAGAGNLCDLPISDDAMFPDSTGSTSFFFARLDLEQNIVPYCSYFGSAQDGNVEIQDILAVGQDSLYLLGYLQTWTPGFTLPPGGYQEVQQRRTMGYLLRLSAPSSIDFGTFLGNANVGNFNQFASRDESGRFWLQGSGGLGLPTTPDAIQHEPMGELYHQYISSYSADLSSLYYATYLDGSIQEWYSGIHASDLSNIWVGGNTESHDYPTTPDALFPTMPFGRHQGFLSRISLLPLCDSLVVDELIADRQNNDILLRWTPAYFPHGCNTNPAIVYEVFFSFDGAQYYSLGCVDTAAFTDAGALTRAVRGYYYVVARVN